PLGNELLRHKSFVTRLHNRLHHRRVIDLLRLINFTPPGHAAGVIVGNVLVVFTYRVDHVALHDLHVENVVKQFASLGTHAPAQFHTPRRVVAHVVLMIALAVEQLHAHGHFVLLG